jgi:hypothetical protein
LYITSDELTDMVVSKAPFSFPARPEGSFRGWFCEEIQFEGVGVTEYELQRALLDEREPGHVSVGGRVNSPSAGAIDPS